MQFNRFVQSKVGGVYEKSDLELFLKLDKRVAVDAEHFLRKYNHEFGKKIKGFKKDVLSLLASYNWPGNIRELENLVERLVVLNRGKEIEAEKLPAEIKGETGAAGTTEKRFKEAVMKFEAEFIRSALDKAGGKKSRAAKMLGIHRNTLIQLEKKLKI